MSTLKISEYSQLGNGVNFGDIPAALEPASLVQNITFSTSTQSASFDGNTVLVGMTPEHDCHIRFFHDDGVVPATTAHEKLTAGILYYRSVPRGGRTALAVIDA